MHLINILNQLEASEKEIKEAVVYFKDKVVSFAAVREFIELFRKGGIEHVGKTLNVSI